MAVTPQTNTTLAAIADALRGRDHFVICGHVSPDGDCLSSQLGLAWALRQMGKCVACVLARDEEPPRDLTFLPGAERLVPAARFTGPCEGNSQKLEKNMSLNRGMDTENIHLYNGILLSY